MKNLEAKYACEDFAKIRDALTELGAKHQLVKLQHDIFLRYRQLHLPEAGD